MSVFETIYILGAGAVGMPLAAFLANAGRDVTLVRTSRADLARQTRVVTVQHGEQQLRVPVETVSLAQLPQLNGTIVVTAKAHANPALARELKAKAAAGPIVLLQNGVGVEQPFVDAGLAPIYRCVLYLTSQATAEDSYSFRPVTPSPIGLVSGELSDLEQCVARLTTDAFPFRVEAAIEREVWKKAIINCVFNSVCPLLDIDNGIFARDEAVAQIAREIIGECVALTQRLKLDLNEHELIEQLLLISKRSDGQLISTLQDIRHGRQTEIAFLNVAIARMAAALEPPLALPRTALLGALIEARERVR